MAHPDDIEITCAGTLILLHRAGWRVHMATMTAFSGAASLIQVPELMPIAMRSTGVSLVYAIGTTLFGGTTQFIVTGLLALTHDPLSPAYYVAATSVISLIAMMMLPETRDVDVSR